MNTETFEAALRRDGFAEIETKSVDANKHVPAHSHAFDVRALVLDGEITLTYEGTARTYRPGDTFTMAAGCEHVEDLGPAGVTYLVGRRKPGAAAAP
jgi:quercetin dioxygenase-like cupin family protein